MKIWQTPFVLAAFSVSLSAAGAEYSLTTEQTAFVRNIVKKDKFLFDMTRAQQELAAINKILSLAPGPAKIVVTWNQGVLSTWRVANAQLAKIGAMSICDQIDYMINSETSNVSFFENLYLARGCKEPAIATHKRRYSLGRVASGSVKKSNSGTGAIGESAFGKACASILKDGPIYDRFSYLSSSSRLEQFYDFACKSDFKSAGELKSTAVSLGIPLEGLPVPLEFGANTDGQAFQQSLQKWCKETKSSLSDTSTRTQFEERINQGMIDVAAKCIEAEREITIKRFGVFVRAEPDNRNLDSFSVTLSFRTGTAIKNQITAVNPNDAVQCFDGGAQIVASAGKPYVTDLNEFTLTCRKDGANSTTLAFNTRPHGATTPLRLPGLSEQAAADAQIRVSSLAEALLAQRLAVNDLTKTLSSVTEKTTTLGARADALDVFRASIQAGVADLPSQDKREGRYTVTFPKAFSSPPIVVATALSNGNDLIVVDTTNVTATGFDVWAWRVNSGEKYSATQHLNWIAIPGQ